MIYFSHSFANLSIDAINQKSFMTFLRYNLQFVHPFSCGRILIVAIGTIDSLPQDIN